MSSQENKPLLTKQQTAELLAVSVQTVTRLLQQGIIKFIRIGRQVRIPQESVDAYLADKGVQQ